MYPYYQPTNNIATEAAMYDLLANYYKYLDPAKHIHYYQMHYQCMQKLCQMQQQQQLHPPAYYHRNHENKTSDSKKAKVRVLHASPDAPAVDIYVNGNKSLQNMTYYQLSKEVELPAGSYQFDIYPAGQTNNPVLSQSFQVEGDKSYTIAAAGRLKNLRLYPVIDNNDTPSNKSKARFWHLSPNAPAVDIVTKGGDVLFRNISFGKISNYIDLAPGKADLEVRLAGKEDVVLTVRDVQFKKNQVYTVVAIGLVDGSPRLEAMIIQP